MIDVERWDAFSDGLLSEHAMRRKLEARGYHVTRYIYPPGTCFPQHSHADDRIDAVLAGRFRLTMAGDSVNPGAGGYLSPPGGVLHGAEVIGNDTVISLDAIKS